MATIQETLFSYKDINNLPGGSYEIIKGERIDMTPTGFIHGEWEFKFAQALTDALKQYGSVAVGEVGILINKSPLKIRSADVVFISHEKKTGNDAGILEVAPELVVEILSPSDNFSDMEEKIRDYFSIGVEKVIVFSPETKKVSVYSLNGKVEFLQLSDEIEVYHGIKIRITG